MIDKLAVAGVLVVSLLAHAPASSAGERQGGRGPSPKKTAPQKVDEYQIPAGSALLLKLRTPLDSASSAVDEQVEATIWSPVIQDGVELIPDGSVLIGKVLEVVPASKTKPLGSITFAFTIIEHATTKSLAMVTTQKVVFTAPSVPQNKRARPDRTDAVIPAGTSFIAMTADALLVRIPR